MKQQRYSNLWHIGHVHFLYAYLMCQISGDLCLRCWNTICLTVQLSNQWCNDHLSDFLIIWHCLSSNIRQYQTMSDNQTIRQSKCSSISKVIRDYQIFEAFPNEWGGLSAIQDYIITNSHHSHLLAVGAWWFPMRFLLVSSPMHQYITTFNEISSM